MDYVSIGCAPSDENCAQVGDDNYRRRARRECYALIGQLTRMHGFPPPTAYFSVIGNRHDFGIYFDVACFFDPKDSEAVDYATRCEDGLPDRWDDEARAELANLPRARRNGQVR